MKPKISQENACAMVLDGIFKQLDKSWEGMWGVLNKFTVKNKLNLTGKDFVKTNVGIASIAVNFRVAFDLFPHAEAESMLDTLFKLLQRFLGLGKNTKAVENIILKYFEAFNNGMLELRNPIMDVAMLLYYKIGLENTEKKVVDESYFVPEPRVVEYLTSVLTLFSGKWNLIKQKFEVLPPAGTGRETEDPKVKVGPDFT